MNPRPFFEDGAPVLAEDFRYPEDDNSSDNIPAYTETAQAIRQLLLSKRDPQIILAGLRRLFCIEEKSDSEVARRLGVSRAAISKIVCEIARTCNLPTGRTATTKSNYRNRQRRLWDDPGYRQKRKASLAAGPSDQSQFQTSGDVNKGVSRE
ncbi:MAG: hypothetical protein PHV34_24535 [Verrucomicrobiae bacterium]|nr:hypothetical protein [Verrucomicrobiae bacterium]